MMDGLVKRYRAILMIGMLLVVVSFFVGIWRVLNQVTIEELAGMGDTTSAAYLSVTAIESVLHAYAEIIP